MTVNCMSQLLRQRLALSHDPCLSLVSSYFRWLMIKFPLINETVCYESTSCDMRISHSNQLLQPVLLCWHLAIIRGRNQFLGVLTLEMVTIVEIDNNNKSPGKPRVRACTARSPQDICHATCWVRAITRSEDARDHDQNLTYSRSPTSKY
jgi:hypothetical protein